MTYLQRHKYHLLAFVILLLIAIISGYLLFTTQDTPNTTQKKDVTQSFSFDNEASENNLNTQTSKHTNITTDKQATTTSTESEISALDGSVSGGINQQSEIIPITYHLSPITLVVANEGYTVEFVTNTTVYALMQNLSASSIKAFSFSGQDYGAGMGYFVTEINEIKNDPQAGKYWIYYVNEHSAQVGISNYIINKGDVIEWKYGNIN